MQAHASKLLTITRFIKICEMLTIKVPYSLPVHHTNTLARDYTRGLTYLVSPKLYQAPFLNTTPTASAQSNMHPCNRRQQMVMPKDIQYNQGLLLIVPRIYWKLSFSIEKAFVQKSRERCPSYQPRSNTSIDTENSVHHDMCCFASNTYRPDCHHAPIKHKFNSRIQLCTLVSRDDILQLVRLTNLQMPSPNMMSNSACLYGLDTYSSMFLPQVAQIYSKQLFAKIIISTAIFIPNLQ